MQAMKQSRYPGVQPFASNQNNIFFGRREDTVQLLSMVLQERLCVLFGKSGYGKSSLINAGIIPKLAEKSAKGKGQYIPISIRFNTWTPEEVQTLTDKLIFHLRKPILEAGIQEAKNIPELPVTLWGGFKQWDSGPETSFILLFDQFEEFFSYPKVQQDLFKEQLAELLYSDFPLFLEENEDRLTAEQVSNLSRKVDVRALFSIRADRLSDLDRMKDRLPAILHKRYELRALTSAQAEEAIVGPAAEGIERADLGQHIFQCPAFVYSDQALGVMMDDLVGREGVETGLVEAFLLQIVCASIENQAIKQQLSTITEHDLPNFITVFDNYYRTRLEDLDEADQRAASKMLEKGLLLVDPQTGDARRLSRDAGELSQSFDADADLLQSLERTYLIRREINSLGGYNYEISHDVLIKPVLKARKSHEAIEESAILAQKRIEAEQLEIKLQEEERRRRRFQRMAAGFFVLSFIAGAALIYGMFQKIKVQVATAKVVDNILKEAQTFVYHLEYDNAWNKIKDAAKLGEHKIAVGKLYLEIAYFYAETGQSEKALSASKQAAGMFENNWISDCLKKINATDETSLAQISANIRLIDSSYVDTLVDRYYPKMMPIPGGMDTIGKGENDEPFLQVSVSPFLLAQTEITWWQYNIYCIATKDTLPESAGWGIEGDNPVINVSWYDAMDYAKWLNKNRGLVDAASSDSTINLSFSGFRLPTECEWEYAARSGFDYPFSGGLVADYFVCYQKNSGKRTKPVTFKKSNQWNLYGMTGNVWEWCWDWKGDYPQTAVQNYTGPRTGHYRVNRGGAWNYGLNLCNISFRSGDIPDIKSPCGGFRVAQTQ
jgi:formylglycine-generating enzyme required for sulfatase activity